MFDFRLGSEYASELFYPKKLKTKDFANEKVITS